MEYEPLLSPPRRTLLIDENDDFLDGLTDWFEGDPQIEIVARAHSHAEALRKIESFRPNTILIDVGLPDGGGFDLTRKIKERWPMTVVILMTFFDRVAIRGEALIAGADECVAKADVATGLKALLRVAIASHDQSTPKIEDVRQFLSSSTARRGRPETQGE